MALSQQPLGLLLVLINIHEGLSTVPNIYSVLSCSHFYPTSETSQNALHTQFSHTMDHTTALWSRSHFIPIFTDEETEAHGSQVTQHLRAWVQPGLPDFKAPALHPQSMLNVIYLSFNVWNHIEMYKITTVYCLSQVGGLLYGLISCCKLMFFDLLVLGDTA